MAKMGRPKLYIDWGKLDDCCYYKIQLPALAEELGISEDTIERAIRTEYDLTFAAYRDKKRMKFRYERRMAQDKRALLGKDTVLGIWYDKNEEGWTDKQEQIHVLSPETKAYLAAHAEATKKLEVIEASVKVLESGEEAPTATDGTDKEGMDAIQRQGSQSEGVKSVEGEV